MSLNYLTVIDNELANDERKQMAKNNFEFLTNTEVKNVVPAWLRRFVVQSSWTVCFLARFFGTACGGVFLAAIFVASEEYRMIHWVCDGIRWFRPHQDEPHICLDHE